LLVANYLQTPIHRRLDSNSPSQNVSIPLSRAVFKLELSGLKVEIKKIIMQYMWAYRSKNSID
jgi:hypothetical protein